MRWIICFSKQWKIIRKRTKSQPSNHVEVVTGYGFPAGWEFKEEDKKWRKGECRTKTSIAPRSNGCTNLLRIIQGRRTRSKDSVFPFSMAARSAIRPCSVLWAVLRSVHTSGDFISPTYRGLFPQRGEVSKDTRKARSKARLLVLDYQRMYLLGALMGAAKIDKGYR